MGLFMGALTGIFLLGLLTVRTRTLGALLGGIAGVASAIVWRYVLGGTWMLMSFMGISVTMLVGYGVSLCMQPPAPEKTRGLTFWTPPEVSPDTE